MNEAKNLTELVKRIDSSLKKNQVSYNIILIDDFSTDSTKSVVARLSKTYPIKYYLKIGKVGKAYSILQGAKASTAKYIVMLDGDLQYAPEYIPQMLELAEKEGCGVVIGNRQVHHESRARQFISKVGHLIYAKVLLGLDSDTQSGLKLFKRELIDHLTEHEIKAWAFDLPLLNTALELNEKIGSVDIDFGKRKAGTSKISLLKTSWQIVETAAKLRFGGRHAFHIKPETEDSMIGAGVIYKRKKFITHTTLHHSKSALITFTFLQKSIIFGAAAALIIGIFVSPQATLIAFIAVLSAIYFLDVLFGLFLILKSLHYPPEIIFDGKRLARLKDEYLPVYTILSPLYKEAHILPQFIKNIERLDWPKNKLDVILLLEEDDKETIEAAMNADLPEHFRILIVPDSLPKTKPKACNYGLAHAKGEYVVIYDAEDEPEPLQLKKALLGFQNVSPDVFCLQAKLNYYNPDQNLLTKLFTAEYSLWFDIVLPGLQAINTTIPLGGTSNHFRTEDLKRLQGWDPFNVAEDADLGARLFRAGYKTAIIDSVTLEEANSNVKNWIRQRSRWIKGYLQTYFVQMRSPLKFAKEQKVHYLIFQLVSGLRVSFMVINPILWAMTAAYFLLFKFVGPQIEALYPPQVFYIALFSAIFGNFLYVYYYMIGAAKRGEWGIIKYVFLVPFYWLLTSIGAFMAFYQLIFRPHFWEKTIHGLVKAEAKIEKEERKIINFGFISQIKDLGVTGYAKIKKYATPEYISGAVMVMAILLGNFFGFLYNAYLGRKLSIEDFGLISLFGSFIYITQILTSAISRTLTHKSAYLYGKYGGTVKELWFIYRKRLITISIIISVAWTILSPFLVRPFKSDDGILPFLIFTPVWIMGIVGAIDLSVLTGSLKFWILSFLIIIEPVVKFITTFAFVQIGRDDLVYLAIPISMFVSFYLAYLAAKKLKGVKANLDMQVVTSFPKRYFATSIVSKLATVVFLSFDIVAAKIFLNPTEAGNYALLSTIGKMVFFLSTLFGQFIIPYASKENAENGNQNNSFKTIFSLTGLSTLFGVLVFGIFGRLTAPILMGPKAYAITQYLPIFCLGIAFHSVASSLATYYQTKKKYEFPVFEFLFSATTILGIIFFHSNIFDFSLMMFIGGVIDLTGIVLLHVFYSDYKTLVRNYLDLIGLFKAAPVGIKDAKSLRILIFNWRDVRHVWSGGAEVYIQELGKRWVKMGHRVTIFCGNDGKNPRNEKIDGIQIVRRGGFYTVYIWAFLYYVLKFRGLFDVIIDSENGIPFFTPLYVRKRIFLLIHHVHQELFRIKFKPPMSWIGKFLEKDLVPLIYGNTEVITVSPSSKADILEHELTIKEPHVVYNGVDLNTYKPGKKAASPMVLYLGRLSRQKSLSVFIKSAKKVLEKLPNVEFVIAGDGDDKERLMKLAKTLGIKEKIDFLGKVDEEEKVNLYQKAWVFVNPSLIEGWGITTIEANACGTPVVASNVAGLRDAVHNPHSGLLVPYGDSDKFAATIAKLIRNTKIRERMSKESIRWAKNFDWTKSAEHFLEHI